MLAVCVITTMPLFVILIGVGVLDADLLLTRIDLIT